MLRALVAARQRSSVACQILVHSAWKRMVASAGNSGGTQMSALSVTNRVTLEVPLSTNRPRICILGTGWAAARLLRDIDPKRFDFVVCSPYTMLIGISKISLKYCHFLSFAMAFCVSKACASRLGAPQSCWFLPSIARCRQDGMRVTLLNPCMHISAPCFALILCGLPCSM
jgi:hypothetical protein